MGRRGRQALLRHQVYAHLPLFDRLSGLSLPSSGGFYTLDRGGGSGAPPGPCRSPARSGAGFAA